MAHWVIDIGRGEVRDGEGRHLTLRRRSFELLLHLARQHDRVVPKDELIATNWRGLAVTDDSLTRCISDIRQALGPGLRDTVRTVAGRGYMLTGWRADGEARLTCFDAAGSARTSNLPGIPNLLGRGEDVATLVRLLGDARLVTIAGSGGVGKTSLAIAVAAEAARADDRVAFVALAPLRAPEAIPGVVAASLGMEGAASSIDAVIAALEGQRWLLVLDNCEHLLAAAADAIERLLAALPELRILTTGRETLRVEGEQVFRLQPLAYPPSAEGLSADAALSYPAIELLCRHAERAEPGFRLAEHEAAAAVELCRRLDGIPLAIVLAAAQLGAMSLAEIVTSLDDRFELLVRGARTSAERQQSLRAMVAWSVDLLPQPERQLFAELGVFSGRPLLGDIAAVCRVAGDKPTPAQILKLADASLLNVHRNAGGRTHYGYHETTRHYALERLGTAESAVRLRLARHLVAVMTLAEAEVEHMPPPQWRDRYLGYLDDVRATLGWCLTPEGDPRLGAELCARSADLFEEASQQAGRLVWIERFIAHVPDLAPAILGRLRFWQSIGASLSIADRHHAQEAARLFAAAGEPFWQGKALSAAMIGDAAAGERSLALEEGEAAMRLLAPHGETRSMTDGLRYRALGLISLGETDAAVELLVASRAIAEKMQDSKGVIWAHDFLAGIEAERGNFAAAAASLAGTLEVAEQIGSATDVIMSSCYLALYRMLGGEPATVPALLRRAMVVRQRIGNREVLLLEIGLVALYLSRRDDPRAAALALFAISRRPEDELTPRAERMLRNALRAWCDGLPPDLHGRAGAQAALWSIDDALQHASSAIATA